MVTYVRFGNHLTPMCLQRLQDSFEDVAYSEFASYLLDVDGFALVREAGVILRQNLSVHYLDVSVVLASLRHCKKF
jgi:hypothetical protein